MKKALLISVAILAGISTVVFAFGSFTGSHSIKYDNDGTWLCHTPTDRMSQSCTMIAPFIPASYLKSVRESGYIDFEKWSDVVFCNGGAGRISVAGRAEPSLTIECR